MDNVAVFARCLEAIANRDIGTLHELSADDVEVRPLRAILEDTVYHGRAGIEQWIGDLYETWAELRLDVIDLTEPEPGSVVALVTLHGRGQGSDASTQMRVEIAGRLEGGLVSYASVSPAG